MEENKEGSNLPVEVKNKGLLGKPPVIKTIDAIRRAGKLLGATAVGITGLGVIALGSGPVVALGAAVSLGGIARLAQNAHMKTEPTLLFGTKRLNSGALGIFQDPCFTAAAPGHTGFQQIGAGGTVQNQRTVIQ